MPTYEYRCRDCGHTFDVVQAMSDDALTVCPVCGGELRKVFAPPAISFKGSGFYATDHGKKSKTSEGTGEKTSEKPAASTGSSDSSSEKKDKKESSKPAEKTAASSSTGSSSDSSSSSGGSGSKASTSDGKQQGS
jgi:putative FmdB family regulatory protein